MPKPRKRAPRFSLVLSGGAVRGFYHLGVLDAMDRAGLRPTEICGCSAGAIVGALWAAQPHPDAAKLLQDTRLVSLLALAPGGTGVLSTSKLERFLRERLPERFEDLHIPLTVNATDIATGDEAVFTSGPLVPALLASSAIPGVFPLVAHGGRLLSDGGIVDNLPVRLARERIILASDVTFPLRTVHRDSWKSSVIANALLIGILTGARRSIEDARREGKTLHIARCASSLFGGDLRPSQHAALVEQGRRDARPVLRRLKAPRSGKTR